jgi:hypothetical protein
MQLELMTLSSYVSASNDKALTEAIRQMAENRLELAPLKSAARQGYDQNFYPREMAGRIAPD